MRYLRHAATFLAEVSMAPKSALSARGARARRRVAKQGCPSLGTM